jgi:DnaJ-class molecular chaperone
MLVSGMLTKEAAEVKKYFRSVAMQIHPDKNSHPLAKEAF